MRYHGGRLRMRYRKSLEKGEEHAMVGGVGSVTKGIMRRLIIISAIVSMAPLQVAVKFGTFSEVKIEKENV